MLYPLKRPKRAYTIQAIVQTVVLISVFYVIHRVHSVAKYLLPMGMFISSFGRAFMVVPRVINLNNSDSNTDSYALSIWLVMTFLGDAFGLLLVQYLMAAGIAWNYAFMIYMVLFLAIAILHQISMDEIEVREVPEETFCQTISRNYNILKEFFVLPKHFLWLMNRAFLAIIYQTVLIWFPYYFNDLGFKA